MVIATGAIHQWLGTTVIAAVVSFLTSCVSVFFARKDTEKRITAERHNTFNWREDCYRLAHIQELTLVDIYKLQSLVSPMEEEEQHDGYIYSYCKKLLCIEKKRVFTSEDAERFREMARLLLKLNWLKYNIPNRRVGFKIKSFLSTRMHIKMDFGEDTLNVRVRDRYFLADEEDVRTRMFRIMIETRVKS